jgi:heme oxygenase
MQYLRSVIWPAHHRVDHHRALKGLMRGRLDVPTYCRVLRIMSWFHEGVQPRILHGSLQHSRGCYLPLDRLSWLREDLSYHRMPVPVPDAPAVEQWLSLDISTPAKWAGAMYAVEGSTKGGLHIAKRVKETLGYEAGRGATFFSGLGPEQTERNWWRMMQCFAQLGVSETDPDMAEGALAIFASLHSLLEYSVGQSGH